MPRYRKDKLASINVKKITPLHIIIKWSKIKDDRDYESIKKTHIIYMGL